GHAVNLSVGDHNTGTVNGSANRVTWHAESGASMTVSGAANEVCGSGDILVGGDNNRVGGVGINHVGNESDIFGVEVSNADSRQFIRIWEGKGMRCDGNTGNLTVSGDIEIPDKEKGLILVSPNGTRFRLTVNNSGVLGTEAP